MTYVYEQLSTSEIARRFYNDEYASWHKNMNACDAIAEYLEAMAEDAGEPVELDTVAFRCDFWACADLAELNKEYGSEFETLDDLRDYAQVIEYDGGFITDYAG